jgi:hypothetical protein
MREHMEIYTREKRLHSNEILADELRLRLATLDVNPFYNKDTFVHKTAAFLRWKEQETENINLMLSVCRCQRHPDHPRDDNTYAAPRRLAMRHVVFPPSAETGRGVGHSCPAPRRVVYVGA